MVVTLRIRLRGLESEVCWKVKGMDCENKINIRFILFSMSTKVYVFFFIKLFICELNDINKMR